MEPRVELKRRGVSELGDGSGTLIAGGQCKSDSLLDGADVDGDYSACKSRSPTISSVC